MRRYNTLEEFYTGKDWRKFVGSLRIERANEDGQVICAHCGKPIVNAFDIIGHHKEALTVDNVNDVMISLNPENIVLLHHACHNRIHHKFERKAREVYLIYGSPCAGKSTYLDSVKEPGDLICDVDAIRRCVGVIDKDRDYSTALLPIVLGIRDQLIDDIAQRKGRWLKAYILGGYPLSSERERICARTGAREIYIDTPKEECLRRLNENPDGRNVEELTRAIEKWWRRYSPPSEIF